MHVDRGCRQAMDQAVLSIHSHMELRTEVPLVPLPGLLHFRVPFSFPVLRRGGRFNDAGVHNIQLLEVEPLKDREIFDLLG